MEYLKRTAIGLLALTVVGTGMSLSLSVVSPEAAIAKSRKKKYRARSNNIVRVAQKDGSYKTLTEAIGKEVMGEFIKLKRDEWIDYSRHVSDWEVARYGEFF